MRRRWTGRVGRELMIRAGRRWRRDLGVGLAASGAAWVNHLPTSRGTLAPPQLANPENSPDCNTLAAALAPGSGVSVARFANALSAATLPARGLPWGGFRRGALGATSGRPRGEDASAWPGTLTRTGHSRTTGGFGLPAELTYAGRGAYGDK